MPSLIWESNRDGRRHIFKLYKRLTSIGRDPENDVAIPDDSVKATHAQVRFNGKEFTLSGINRSSPVYINGRKRHSHCLNHRDEIMMGEAFLLFDFYDENEVKKDKAREDQSAGYRRLVDISHRLLEQYDVEKLLSDLMDSVIELTNADKGFLILMDGSRLEVKVARNLKRESIEDGLVRISDSIISKVVREKRPIIVSDALNDEEFKSSVSVVNLKLCSVMCAPMMNKGELLGLLYVGNDNVVSLFEEESLELMTVFAAQAALILRNAILVNELKVDNRELRRLLEEGKYGELIGSCEGMREVFRSIDRVATTDVSVLITGETGTGKELIAREIHKRSVRKEGPFITINCGAIPENLLESELFGHMRGAFTGAVATREGKFQTADGGTLFLDEIGEMPSNLQVKLLRALQEKQVTKVGGTRAENVDIRILTATNKTLEEEIKKGTFREDLYYRINVINLFLPPLRERGEDIAVLARYLLDKFRKQYRKQVREFTSPSITAMKRYRWPGNIRELENRIKQAVILTDGLYLNPDDLGLTPESMKPILPLAQAREEFQRQYIHKVLALNNGNRSKAARELEVDPRTVFRYLEKERDREDRGS